MTRRLLRTSVAIAALVLGTATAQANGRFPTAQQLIFEPGKPDVMVLRTTFGILVSSDQGKSWDWICESAIGYGRFGQEDPAIGVTGGGALIAALYEGLAVSPDTGCSWSFATGALGKQPIVDVAVRPNAPHAALALLSTTGGVNEAGTYLVASQLFATADDGAHWAPYGVALDPTLQPTTVEVSASDPHRVYVSAVRTFGAGSAALLVSIDDGAHFVEQPIPINPENEDSAFIGAVDPSNADLVYVRTGTGDVSRLLVSADAGAHFRTVYAGGPMLGFALSSDGATVYLGGPEDGLQRASASDFKFKQQSSIPVGCIALEGSTVYTCVVGGDVLLARSDAGSPLAPALSLTGLREPLSCPAGSSTAQCASQWVALQVSLAQQSADAGSADAGMPAPPPPPSNKGCGCGSGPNPAATGAGSGVLAACVLFLMRRRRAKHDG